MNRKGLTLSLIFVSLAVLTCISAGCVTQGNTSSDVSNTLVYAGEMTSTINPLLTSHGELIDIIFSGLLKYDINSQPVLDLADNYTISSDGMTYTFTLKKGVTWHDGQPFTAADVVFTYDTLVNDETLTSDIKSNYEDIGTITAKDDYTVEIVMKNYNAAMLGYFTRGIVPKHLLEGKDINTDSFNQNPVGTGRFKFVEWDKAGGMIILERNTAYYGKVPNIERIVYKPTTAGKTSKTTMLTTGEADLAWLNANYADTFRGKEGFKNIDFKTADYRGISIDYRSEFWQRNGDSVAVLNYAIDKNAIVNSVLYNEGFPAYSVIQLSEFGGNKAADIYSYDIAVFDRKMAELGWKKGSDGIYERNGEKFHFRIHVNSNEEERVDIANLCAQSLKAAGVNMEVVVRPDWNFAGYDGFLSGNACEYDPDLIYANLVTGGSDNSMQYSNADVDALLKAGRHEADKEKRVAIYHEFEEVYAENPGIILIAYLNGNFVSTDKVSGLDTGHVLGHHAVGVMWNIENWTLSK